MAHDPLAALGEKILAELGDPRTNNTLVRWLSHHTARLIHEADDAQSTGAADADERASAARNAILELWAARSHWPAGWPPPHVAELARRLDTIPILSDSQPWATDSTLLGLFHTMHLRILSTLLDLAGSDVDQAEVETGEPGAEPQSDTQSEPGEEHQGEAGEQTRTRDDHGASIATDWLARFGEHLTDDEVVLLQRVAQWPTRIWELSEWWSSARSTRPAGEEEYDETADQPLHEAERADSLIVEHPLLTLVDAYRDTLVSILVAARARAEPESAPSREREEPGEG